MSCTRRAPTSCSGACGDRRGGRGGLFERTRPRRTFGRSAGALRVGEGTGEGEECVPSCLVLAAVCNADWLPFGVGDGAGQSMQYSCCCAQCRQCRGRHALPSGHSGRALSIFSGGCRGLVNGEPPVCMADSGGIFRGHVRRSVCTSGGMICDDDGVSGGATHACEKPGLENVKGTDLSVRKTLRIPPDA
eukprot:1701793-Prymnesium_polylepis.1